MAGNIVEEEAGRDANNNGDAMMVVVCFVLVLVLVYASLFLKKSWNSINEEAIIFNIVPFTVGADVSTKEDHSLSSSWPEIAYACGAKSNFVYILFNSNLRGTTSTWNASLNFLLAWPGTKCLDW